MCTRGIIRTKRSFMKHRGFANCVQMLPSKAVPIISTNKQNPLEAININLYVKFYFEKKMSEVTINL